LFAQTKHMAGIGPVPATLQCHNIVQWHTLWCMLDLSALPVECISLVLGWVSVEHWTPGLLAVLGGDQRDTGVAARRHAAWRVSHACSGVDLALTHAEARELAGAAAASQRWLALALRACAVSDDTFSWATAGKADTAAPEAALWGDERVCQELIDADIDWWEPYTSAGVFPAALNEVVLAHDNFSVQMCTQEILPSCARCDAWDVLSFFATTESFNIVTTTIRIMRHGGHSCVVRGWPAALKRYAKAHPDGEGLVWACFQLFQAEVAFGPQTMGDVLDLAETLDGAVLQTLGLTLWSRVVVRSMRLGTGWLRRAVDLALRICAARDIDAFSVIDEVLKCPRGNGAPPLVAVLRCLRECMDPNDWGESVRLSTGQYPVQPRDGPHVIASLYCTVPFERVGDADMEDPRCWALFETIDAQTVWSDDECAQLLVMVAHECALTEKNTMALLAACSAALVGVDYATYQVTDDAVALVMETLMIRIAGTASTAKHYSDAIALAACMFRTLGRSRVNNSYDAHSPLYVCWMRAAMHPVATDKATVGTLLGTLLCSLRQGRMDELIDALHATQSPVRSTPRPLPGSRRRLCDALGFVGPQRAAAVQMFLTRAKPALFGLAKLALDDTATRDRVFDPVWLGSAVVKAPRIRAMRTLMREVFDGSGAATQECAILELQAATEFLRRHPQNPTLCEAVRAAWNGP
jgi:hypothetical protein